MRPIQSTSLARRAGMVAPVLAAALVVTGCSSGTQPGGGPAASASAAPSAPAHDWAPVAQTVGKQGNAQPGGVYRVDFPRSDLTVTSQGVSVTPALSLGTYFIFYPMGDHVMMMGDMVVTNAEKQAVIDKLTQGNVTITAIHEHLADLNPQVWWMHVHATGDQTVIARTLRQALDLTHTPTTAGGASQPAAGLDTGQLDQILGRKGIAAAGGVYKFSFPRAETISEGGMGLPAALGFTTAIGFQPTGGGKAAINGDFVLIESEVAPVMTALRQGGIEVVSLHNHGLGEQPRLFFMHFWANDDAVKLARTLRAALDKTNVTH